ncbi:MAG: transglycosylase SLT domain-containing protein [Alistipes sp.]|nr:transglycosylase SLT domain-containing protein [Alistipes sp.]
MILSLVVLAGLESSLGSTVAAPALFIEEPTSSTEGVDDVEATEVKVDTLATEATNVSEQIAVTAKLPQKISKFDPLMKRIGEESGHDWRFMSAIAYCESRFTEGLVSKRGAAGLMQVMPVVARHFKVPVSHIYNTETNVRLACRLLSEFEKMLRIPESTPEHDRLSIILASYNAGLGHVQDARRLAKADGANPNSWAVVSNYLKLKANPDYYTRSEVKAGRFSGSRETLGFVELAMSKYSHYCEIAW